MAGHCVRIDMKSWEDLGCPFEIRMINHKVAEVQIRGTPCSSPPIRLWLRLPPDRERWEFLSNDLTGEGTVFRDSTLVATRRFRMHWTWRHTVEWWFPGDREWRLLQVSGPCRQTIWDYRGRRVAVGAWIRCGWGNRAAIVIRPAWHDFATPLILMMAENWRPTSHPV